MLPLKIQTIIFTLLTIGDHMLKHVPHVGMDIKHRYHQVGDLHLAFALWYLSRSVHWYMIIISRQLTIAKS